MISSHPKMTMLSSHVKRSPLLWLHNKLGLSQKQTMKMTRFGISLVFIYIINRTLPDCLEIRNFSSYVEKYSTCLLRSLVRYFSTLKEKLHFSGQLYVHVISSILARVQPQSFHLNGHTIGFHPQIQTLIKMKVILL